MSISAAPPRLTALAIATPCYDLPQEEVASRAAQLFAPVEGGFHRLAPVYRNAEIDQRHACVPIDWFLEPHGFAERNDLFLEHATLLLAEAAERALDQAGLKPQDIDAIVTVCSSGVATPALDARVMGKVAFRADVQRTPIFGMGCVGGVVGLARAAALAQAQPQSRVMLLVVELCTLTFRRHDRSKSNIVATALFGDGAGAAIITCREADSAAATADGRGLTLGPWGEHTWPDTLDIMGWDVADDGLKVVFSRDIPALVRSDLRPVLDGFLERHGLKLNDIDEFICHPGGAKVLDALEDSLDLQRGDLKHSRDMLSEHGNMSAVTVLFVLQASLQHGRRGRRLMTSLGPGFTAGMLVLDAA